jgi:transposase InsO family protein
MGVQGNAQPIRWTTNSRHDFPRPYPVDCPQTTRADQAWIVDLTCVWLRDECAYPALLMDVFTRRHVGWYWAAASIKGLCEESTGAGLTNFLRVMSDFDGNCGVPW